jgi:hypothetical protein
MEPKSKIIIGAIFQAVAIFTGSGIFGFGEDTVAILFQDLGIEVQTSTILSKLILGISTGGAVWFYMFGCAELRDGVDVTYKRS